MAAKKITLGLSEHRPEMIPLIAWAMQQHQAILLEEPADDAFKRMLTGKLGVEDYLRGIDVEYPEFSRSMCYLLRKLRTAGKVILQVEPYLEILLGIHAYFAEGHGPDDLKRDSIQYPVQTHCKKRINERYKLMAASPGRTELHSHDASAFFERLPKFISPGPGGGHAAGPSGSRRLFV